MLHHDTHEHQGKFTQYLLLLRGTALPSLCVLILGVIHNENHTTALYVDAGLQASKYCNVTTFAVLISDYCITLEVENLLMTVRKSHIAHYLHSSRRRIANNEDLRFLDKPDVEFDNQARGTPPRLKDVSHVVFAFRDRDAHSVQRIRATAFLRTGESSIVSSFSIILTISPPISWVAIRLSADHHPQRPRLSYPF
ncbi:uncharacterized protein EDB91DRAFT_1339530 [Suillus paluster]|uniref:uncharacterized protein n=1 Tax=Suillus paluster TaxID=48578 RepID=UPI001B85C0C4|nr:uncharacterized protein EDB91DRAFT_1339530 [Suillus paluster]KAG1727084.1 hypothetical protein EDB91DRAFT_1339530 [Suillus paluster]